MSSRRRLVTTNGRLVAGEMSGRCVSRELTATFSFEPVAAPP
jgi:hypothetical protein